MQPFSPFEIAMPGLLPGAYLAEVTSVEDPDSLGRVQLRLLHADGVADHDGPLWARVAAPFAGADRGAFFIPDVGDEVLVVFLQGDMRFPLVIGGLWNGDAQPPEQLPGSRVDRWTITGKAGTRVAIVEEQSGNERISFTTPGGVSGELTDESGGKIELDVHGTTITIDTTSVTIQASAEVKVEAAQVKVSAGSVNVDTAVADFSGLIKCMAIETTSVISKMYSQGAGNIW
jgi:uncharacterized protein involved in type VI secretion and phage assembly